MDSSQILLNNEPIWPYGIIYGFNLTSPDSNARPNSITLKPRDTAIGTVTLLQNAKFYSGMNLIVKIQTDSGIQYSESIIASLSDR